MSDLKTDLLITTLSLLGHDYLDDPEEEIRKEIYSTIVKFLTASNHETIHRIMITHESKNALNRYNSSIAIADEYTKRVSLNSYSLSPSPYSHAPDPVSTLLFKLGIVLSSHSYFQSFEYSVTTCNVELGITLLSHSMCGQAVKERSLITAMERRKTPFILALINSTQFTVTIDLILAAIKHDLFLVFLTLLKASDIKKVSKKDYHWAHYTKWTNTYPQDYRWTLYSIWAYATLTDDKRRACCNLLTRLLGPSLVMHFTIMNVLVVLSSKIMDPSSQSVWLNINHLLTNDAVKTAMHNFSAFAKKHTLKYKAEDSGIHKEILTMLNGYFSRTATLPDDAVIASTFKKMKQYLVSFYKDPFSGRFFKIRPLNPRDYIAEIYWTLRDVEEALKNSDAPDQEPVNDYNNIEKETSIVHGKD